MTYGVKFVSQKGSLLCIISIIIMSGILGLLFIPKEGIHDSTKTFFLVTFWGLTVMSLWQWLAIERTIWDVDESGIRIHWTKKAIFGRGGSIIMAWSEIAKIYRGFEPRYYSLKIKPVSGKVIIFYHDPLTTRDEFKEMLDELDVKLASKLKSHIS